MSARSARRRRVPAWRGVGHGIGRASARCLCPEREEAEPPPGKKGLLLFPWVTSCASGERWAEAAEAEHCQSGDRLGVVEAEATADDQADLGVQALHPGVGEAVEEACFDPLLVD